MGAFCGSLLFFAKSAASDFGCRKVWNRQEYVTASVGEAIPRFVRIASAVFV